MKRLLSTSLRGRFITGIGLVFLALVAGTLSNLLSIQSTVTILTASLDEMRNETHPMSQLQTLLLRTAMPPNDYLINGDPAERVIYERLSSEVNETFEALISLELPLKADVLAALKTQYQGWQKAQPLGRDILALPYPPNSSTAVLAMERFDSSLDSIVANLDRVHEFTHQDMLERLSRSRNRKRRVYDAILIFASLGLVTIIWGGRLLGADLDALQELEQGALRFAKGELSHRLKLNRHDELGRLASVLNQMAGQMLTSRATLVKKASYDELTGLYNRYEFQQRVTEEFRRAQRYENPLSLLVLDLDHFKRINDTYGHHQGDEVLKQLSEVIRQNVRDVDIPARWGGEEFVIITPETDWQEAKLLAERIRHAVAHHDFGVGELTISIGVSGLRSVDTPEDIFKRADAAMYLAKRRGRNCVEVTNNTT